MKTRSCLLLILHAFITVHGQHECDDDDLWRSLSRYAAGQWMTGGINCGQYSMSNYKYSAFKREVRDDPKQTGVGDCLNFISLVEKGELRKRREPESEPKVMDISVLAKKSAEGFLKALKAVQEYLQGFQQHLDVLESPITVTSQGGQENVKAFQKSLQRESEFLQDFVTKYDVEKAGQKFESSFTNLILLNNISNEVHNEVTIVKRELKSTFFDYSARHVWRRQVEASNGLKAGNLLEILKYFKHVEDLMTIVHFTNAAVPGSIDTSQVTAIQTTYETALPEGETWEESTMNDVKGLRACLSMTSRTLPRMLEKRDAQFHLPEQTLINNWKFYSDVLICKQFLKKHTVQYATDPNALTVSAKMMHDVTLTTIEKMKNYLALLENHIANVEVPLTLQSQATEKVFSRSVSRTRSVMDLWFGTIESSTIQQFFSILLSALETAESEIKDVNWHSDNIDETIHGKLNSISTNEISRRRREEDAAADGGGVDDATLRKHAQIINAFIALSEHARILTPDMLDVLSSQPTPAS